MIIYGGIFEVTKELNDMHLFDLEQDKWICLFEEINSPKKFRDNDSPTKSHGLGHSSPTLKGNKNGLDINNLHNFEMAKQRKSMSYAVGTQGKGKSPQRRKKKMLAIKTKEVENIIKLESPTSISMKNSFLIKNADPSFEKCYAQIKKRTMEKTHTETFDQQLTKTAGKRPPARDGHTGIVINEQFFVFGGDRHHMPFNDFHMLDINSEFEMKNFMF